MSKQKVNWYCTNRAGGCQNVLGNIADGELVINLENVVTINTYGTSLVVSCEKCGSVKLWYPSLDNSVLGAVKSFRRELTQNQSSDKAN
jgi:hypothetical protein